MLPLDAEDGEVVPLDAPLLVVHVAAVVADVTPVLCWPVVVSVEDPVDVVEYALPELSVVPEVDAVEPELYDEVALPVEDVMPQEEVAVVCVELMPAEVPVVAVPDVALPEEELAVLVPELLCPVAHDVGVVRLVLQLDPVPIEVGDDVDAAPVEYDQVPVAALDEFVSA